MVCAQKGDMLAGADFSQLEYRAIALLSGEGTLLNLFNDPAKPDLHSTNAARLYGTAWDMVDPEKASEPKEKERRKTQRKLLRKLTKMGLYGALYFGSASTIQANLRAEALRESDPEMASYLRNMPIQQCQKFVDSIPKLWPKVEEFRQRRAVEVPQDCMWVAPLSGRKRFWPLAMVDKTQCFNNTIQSLAGDIMNWRTLELMEVLPKHAEIILQVHDSIVIECPEEMVGEVRELLDKVLTVELTLGGHSCLFPVDSAVGKSWSEV